MNRLTDALYDELQPRFHKHRYNARQRGIGFELTFSQWLHLWLGSSRALERGTQAGRYVMARNGDAGPYALGNVSIIPHSENVAQAMRGKSKSETTRKKLSKAMRRYWKQRRAEARP